MRLLHDATLILLLSMPSACGDQLVEFGRGPGTGSDNPDAGGTGTGNPPPGVCSLAPLALRSAEGMAVLAGSTVTSTGATSGRQVVLIGGARASNVFWQVGSSATLGTASVFQGTIMADQSITMAAGATLNGRVLARIAAVSLDSNTIVMPAL